MTSYFVGPPGGPYKEYKAACAEEAMSLAMEDMRAVLRKEMPPPINTEPNVEAAVRELFKDVACYSFLEFQDLCQTGQLPE